jgi:hypothetical protein
MVGVWAKFSITRLPNRQITKPRFITPLCAILMLSRVVFFTKYIVSSAGRLQRADEHKLAVYQRRRRIRGQRLKRLMRQRGERVERSSAHMYETGCMRRTHLRRHVNIIRRLLIHAGTNLSPVMRKLSGYGTPRDGRAI